MSSSKKLVQPFIDVLMVRFEVAQVRDGWFRNVVEN
jgi:hypothetical protein